MKITDLQVIATTLLTSLEAGCDDLATCATRPSRPLPFTELATGGDQHADS